MSSIIETAMSILMESSNQITVKKLQVGDTIKGYTNNKLVSKKVKEKIANRNNYFKIIFDDGSDSILHAQHELTLA